jgi:hypothetical protein
MPPVAVRGPVPMHHRVAMPDPVMPDLVMPMLGHVVVVTRLRTTDAVPQHLPVGHVSAPLCRPPD